MHIFVDKPLKICLINYRLYTLFTKKSVYPSHLYRYKTLIRPWFLFAARAYIIIRCKKTEVKIQTLDWSVELNLTNIKASYVWSFYKLIISFSPVCNS